MITAIKIIFWLVSPLCLIAGLIACLCGAYFFFEGLFSKKNIILTVLTGLVLLAVGIVGIMFLAGVIK